MLDASKIPATQVGNLIQQKNVSISTWQIYLRVCGRRPTRGEEVHRSTGGQRWIGKEDFEAKRTSSMKHWFKICVRIHLGLRI